jgi:EAL domain-containing protein (putative c-di-GMP-specific phosphodiesterase class I)
VLKEKNVESIVGFVESANTMATLWQMDVSLIQGYYMGAPSPDIGQASDF